MAASAFVQMNDMALTPQARDVWQGAREILLSDAPNLDASERVGLLTVVAGIRRVALFLDVADLKVKKLVRLLGKVELIAFGGRVPEPVCTWESPHRAEITSIFRGKCNRPPFGCAATSMTPTRSTRVLTRSRPVDYSGIRNVVSMPNRETMRILRMP